MLNNPYERNQRSDPYWPPQIGSEFVYGNLMRVRLLSEKKERSYVERKIEIQKKSGGLSPSLSPKTAQKQNSHSRDSRIFRSDADILSQSQDLVSPEPQQDDAIVVVHLQYTNWDDFTVPGDINEFTDFLNRTEMVYEKTRINQSPITVHCFGGQGRTGVFITSFLALRKLKQFGGKPQMVTELIQFLRNERKNLVETVVRHSPPLPPPLLSDSGSEHRLLGSQIGAIQVLLPSFARTVHIATKIPSQDCLRVVETHHLPPQLHLLRWLCLKSSLENQKAFFSCPRAQRQRQW